jgi:hypothetical protein
MKRPATVETLYAAYKKPARSKPLLSGQRKNNLAMWQLSKYKIRWI